MARRLLALVSLIAVAGIVPGGISARDEGSGRITVFAAASLTDVLPKIDPRPRYGFAGSDQLAFEIQQGAPADVFAAASPKYPELLYRQGLVEKPVAFDAKGNPTYPKVGEKVRLKYNIGGLQFIADQKVARNWPLTHPLDQRLAVLLVRGGLRVAGCGQPPCPPRLCAAPP